MESSRAQETLKQRHASGKSSSSRAKPSSFMISGTPLSESAGQNLPGAGLAARMRMFLTMGFEYTTVAKACSLYGDDVDSIICYLTEMSGNGSAPGNSSNQEGKGKGKGKVKVE